MRRRDFLKTERDGLNARLSSSNCWAQLRAEVGCRREIQFRGAAHG
jgi:hypothetical protein